MMTDQLLVGIGAAREAGASRFLLRAGWVCPRCGRSEHRVKRGECHGCRVLKRPVLRDVREAAWRAIRGIPLTGLQVLTIGSNRDFRCWLVAECERLGFDLRDYGRTWAIYHRRKLRDHDLRKNSERLLANRLANLEVRAAHNSVREVPHG
jgi:ribosomal protein L37E